MDAEKWSIGDGELKWSSYKLSRLKFIPNTRHFVCNSRVETETLSSLSMSYLVRRVDPRVGKTKTKLIVII